MPTSNLATWPWIIHLCWEAKPVTVLDVGPGWGKAATLLREYVPSVKRVEAVEAHAPYIAAHHLDRLYDVVHVGDVCDLDDRALARFDLVLMVEVIEHLTRADGLDLIDRIPGHVVVCTPQEFFPQDDPALPASERHLSLWSIADFEATGRLSADVSQLGGVICRLNPKEASDGR